MEVSGQHTGDTSQYDSKQQHPLANYQLSSDELKVLRECNAESFFQRSLPLSTVLGVSTYLGVRHGILAPNAKYGSVPKVIVGVVVGYFLGKFSYQRKCAEKMMELPNSRLGQLLRQRRQGPVHYDLLPQQGLEALPPLKSFASDIYSDEGVVRSDSLNLDTERPLQSDINDTYNPPIDEENFSKESAESSVSYEDLRRKNRENYSKSRFVYNKPIAQSSSPIQTKESEKSKYEDVWS